MTRRWLQLPSSAPLDRALCNEVRQHPLLGSNAAFSPYRRLCIAAIVFWWHAHVMPVIPTLEDRIRHLCTRAVSADDSEAEAILAELRAALHEHIRFTRQLTAATLNWETPRIAASSKLTKLSE